MKISIITVVYNGADTIKDTIESVLNQSYEDIEYIIIDGLSSDGTQKIVRSYGSKISKFISEKDNGLYDAMNKGIKLATGDVVGILNSDDTYTDKFVIDNVVKQFQTTNVDLVYGDIVIVDALKENKIIRYYRSKNFKVQDLKRGIMPGHASVFIKRIWFEKYGYYYTNFEICADFDLLLRFLYIHKLSHSYLPKILVNMKMGGISNRSLLTKYKIYLEMKKSILNNNLKFNLFRYLMKYYSKMFQFIERPKAI